jgi:hypothetical protein
MGVTHPGDARQAQFCYAEQAGLPPFLHIRSQERRTAAMGEAGMQEYMRWLLIVYVVSFAALLFAAAGVARHIWLQRARIKRVPPMVFEPNEETDHLEAKL